jgi:hypothetical protein
MKHLYISVLMLLQATFLLGHGFSTDVLVLLAEGGWQQISTLCYRTQKKKIAVASYDTISSYQTTSKTTRGGRSKSSCFIHFGFDERLQYSQHHEVACTPTQEFYNAKNHQWVPAHKIKIGDGLFCANSATKAASASGYEWAEKKWDSIRKSKDDVKRIAANTGIDEQTIQQIKDHVFHTVHKKRYETAPFDADYDMAKAWERLEAGNMLKADLELLRHEFAESLLMGNQAMDYDTAHNIVEKFFSWRNEL